MHTKYANCDWHMRDTTIRVRNSTYKTIVKTRGAFEQTFGKKLTLDETMFLAASYINLAYDEFQNLMRGNLLEIVEKDGTYTVRLKGLNEITQKVLPRIITAFENFQAMLKTSEEQKKPITAIVGT